MVADRRGIAFMGFTPTVTTGAVTIRGTVGVSPATAWFIGTMNSGDNSNGSGSVNLTTGTGRGNGSIDAAVGSLILGRQAGGRGVGLLTYDTGVVKADFVVIGDSQPSSAQAGAGTGNLSVLGTASLSVNNSLTLGRVINAGAATIAGTLTLGTTTTPGGTVRVAGDIIDGGGTSTVIANGGSLQAKHISATGAPIDTFTINGTHLTLDLGTGISTGQAIATVGNLTANNTVGSNLISLKLGGSVTSGTT